MPRAIRGSGLIWLLLVFLVAAVSEALGAPSYTPLNGPGCIQSDVVDSLLAPIVERAAAGSQPISKDMMGPMRDREIQLLIQALEPVDLKTGEGRTIRAVAQGTELAPRRMHVLMDDVLAVLAGIHAREALTELRNARDVPPAERALGERQLRAITRCLGIRFEERGGGQTLRESERIVTKYRAGLEKLILQAEPPGQPPR